LATGLGDLSLVTAVFGVVLAGVGDLSLVIPDLGDLSLTIPVLGDLSLALTGLLGVTGLNFDFVSAMEVLTGVLGRKDCSFVAGL